MKLKGIFAMKILEINKYYYERRGAERHFLDLIELLEQKGHEVAVFSMNHPHNRTSLWQKYFLSYVGYQKNDSTVWEKTRGIFRMFWSIEAKRKINRLLDDFKPEVVHIHNIYHQLSPFILFEIKKRKIPIIMTVHDYKLICPNYMMFHNGRPYDRCQNGKFYQCLVDCCVDGSFFKSLLGMLEAYWHRFWGTYRKNVDWYIVPSQFVKDKLKENGIEEEKIVVLAHFISEQENGNVLNGQKILFENYAIYFGEISKQKGVDVLVDIFSKRSDLKLLLAGSAYAEKFEIIQHPNIVFLGRLSKSKLFSFVKKARFVISASRVLEPFGLVALESIAQGKPFLGFRSGGFTEIIENGKNGFLAENEAELAQNVDKLAKKVDLFDQQQIKSQALEKYGSQGYYQCFKDLLEGLSKEKR